MTSRWTGTFSPVYTKGFYTFQFPLSDRLWSVRLPLVIMVAFSIANLNVDGIRDDDKRVRIFEYLRSLKHDFFLRQETHVQTEDIEGWSAERGGGGGGGACFWNPDGNKSRGVGIVCNVSLEFEDLEVRRDFYGRMINVKLSLHDWKFQIMCVYTPNDPRSRWEFFSDLWRDTFPEIPLFMGGVFNCIDSLELDKAGSDAQAGDKGSVELNDFADLCLFVMFLESSFQRRSCLPDITSLTLICRGLIEFMPQRV